MNTAMSYSAPQAQRHVVLNCQFARHVIRERIERKANANTVKSCVQLFKSAGPDYDWNVGVSDPLYMIKESGNRRRSPDLNNQGQQPWVLSSLNDLYVPKDVYQKARGIDKHIKLRNVLHQTIQFVGLSLKGLTYEGHQTMTLDDPVALVSGVTHTLNTGRFPINPMQLVAWDAPDDDREMEKDKTETTGSTPTVRKLITVPVEKSVMLSADSMIQWARKVHGEQGNTLDEKKKQIACDEVDVFDALVELVKAVAIAANPSNGQKAADDTEAFKEKLHECLNRNEAKVKTAMRKVIDAVREPDREANSRIIGRCLRGALPGERLDILLF